MSVWIRCTDKMPKIGQRVILEKDSVIQNYMPTLGIDDQEGYYWDFEEEGCSDPLVDMEFDRWMPQPEQEDK